MKKAYRLRPLLFFAIIFAILLRFELVLAALSFLWTLTSPVFAAFLIAITLDAFVSPVERILRKTGAVRGVRACSVCITLLILALVVALVVVYFIPQLLKAILQLLSALPRYIEQLYIWLEPAFSYLGYDLSDLLKYSELNTQVAADHLLSAVRSVVGTVSKASRFILSVALAVYILFDKHKLLTIVERTKCIFPKTPLREKCYSAVYLCAITYKRFISGQMLESLILGVLCFGGMSLIGLPYALIISVFVGITAVVPVIGAYVGGIISALLLFLESPVQAGIFLLF